MKKKKAIVVMDTSAILDLIQFESGTIKEFLQRIKENAFISPTIYIELEGENENNKLYKKLYDLFDNEIKLQYEEHIINSLLSDEIRKGLKRIKTNNIQLSDNIKDFMYKTLRRKKIRCIGDRKKRVFTYYKAISDLDMECGKKSSEAINFINRIDTIYVEVENLKNDLIEFNKNTDDKLDRKFALNEFLNELFLRCKIIKEFIDTYKSSCKKYELSETQKDNIKNICNRKYEKKEPFYGYEDFDNQRKIDKGTVYNDQFIIAEIQEFSKREKVDIQFITNDFKELKKNNLKVRMEEEFKKITQNVLEIVTLKINTEDKRSYDFELAYYSNEMKCFIEEYINEIYIDELKEDISEFLYENSEEILQQFYDYNDSELDVFRNEDNEFDIDEIHYILYEIENIGEIKLNFLDIDEKSFYYYAIFKFQITDNNALYVKRKIYLNLKNDEYKLKFNNIDDVYVGGDIEIVIDEKYCCYDIKNEEILNQIVLSIWYDENIIKNDISARLLEHIRF